jgi:phage-related protein
MAQDGKISAETVIAAMSEAEASLEAEFAKIAPTVAGAFQVLQNEALNFVREFNEGTAVGEIFANTILFIAENFEVFAASAAALAIILVGSVIPAILAMTAAMLANPIGAIAVGIAAATVALAVFGDTQLTIAGQTATVWQVVKAAIATVVDVVTAVVGVVRAAFNTMLAAVSPFFAVVREWLSGFISDWSETMFSVLGFIKNFINSAIGLFFGLVRSVSPIITDGIPAAFRLAMALAYNAVLDGVNNIVKKVAFAIAVIAKLAEGLPGVSDTAGKDTYFGIVNSLDLEGAKIQTEGLTAAVNESRTAIAGAFNSAQIDYVGAFGDAVAGAGSKLKDVFIANMKEVTATTTEGAAAADLLAGSLGGGSGGAAGAMDGAGTAAGGAAKGVSDMNDQLERQKQILDDTVGKRQEFIDQLSAAATLLSSGAITAGDALGQVINTGLLSEDLFEGTQELMNMRIEQFRVMYEQINMLRQADLISEQTARQAMAQIDLQYIEQRLSSQKAFFGELSKLSRSGNRTVAAIGKAAAVTQATIDGYLAIQKALASHPPPMNYAIAAAIGATTAANIASILSQNTNFATGGSFVVPGTGGVDSQMVAMRASPGERVSVQTPTQVRKGTAAANAGMGGSGAAPQVNQRIINVIDPAMVGDFLSSPEGEDILVNVIGRSGIMGRGGA